MARSLQSMLLYLSKGMHGMKFNLWKLDDHPELVSALFAAHREAAIANDNASKLCVQQAWGGSGRFENAIIAGMATIGALHAPLSQARELWEGGDIPHGRIPGFGNSFYPHDPAFNRVALALQRKHQSAIARLDMLSRQVQTGLGKTLWPNAAMYTAIVASICEVPRGLESALFALARIPAWAELCASQKHPKVGDVR